MKEAPSTETTMKTRTEVQAYGITERGQGPLLQLAADVAAMQTESFLTQQQAFALVARETGIELDAVVVARVKWFAVLMLRDRGYRVENGEIVDAATEENAWVQEQLALQDGRHTLVGVTA